MNKNKIVAIVGVTLVVIMLVFSGIEAGLANSRDSVVGEWDTVSATESAKYIFSSDGTVKREALDKEAVNGEWSYSWFKITVKFEGEDTKILKCGNNELKSDNMILTKKVSDEREVTTYVKFYSEGFFGYGEKGNFKYWSFAHFTPILLFAIAVYLIYHYRDALRNWKHEENFRFIFAAAMLFVEMSYFWRLLYVGSSEPGEVVDLLDKLPLQVCEWTCILAVFMMMKKSRAIYPICFYVCFTIGIFPLLTPSVITTTGPAYYRYYQYWLEHILPPLAVFYMTFVHGFRPTKKGIISAVGFMLTLMVLALICNANIPGANYLYLAEGTTDGGGSIMDPIRDMVGGSTAALIILLSAVVIGIFYLAFYMHKWIIALSEKVKSKNKVQLE